MSLTVTINLPAELERKLRTGHRDLGADVREAYALELFRRGEVTHAELSQVLGLDRFATDAFLKQHGILDRSLTMADLDADAQTLSRILGKSA